MFISSVFPVFAEYHPELIRGWIAKGVAGTPVGADEHNAGVIMISIQRDVVANQAQVVVPGGFRLPSVRHNGQNVAATGWSDRVAPVQGESQQDAEQRRTMFDAATFALRQLAITSRIVPATAPSGAIDIGSGSLFSEARTMALFGPAQDAARLPQDASGAHAVLEDRDLMQEISNAFGGLVSERGIGAQAISRSSVQNLANMYSFLSDAGNRTAMKWGALLLAGVIGARMLSR